MVACSPSRLDATDESQARLGPCGRRRGRRGSSGSVWGWQRNSLCLVRQILSWKRLLTSKAQASLVLHQCHLLIWWRSRTSGGWVTSLVLIMKNRSHGSSDVETEQLARQKLCFSSIHLHQRHICESISSDKGHCIASDSGVKRDARSVVYQKLFGGKSGDEPQRQIRARAPSLASRATTRNREQHERSDKTSRK